MTAWQSRAACRDHDPRLWDSDAGIVAQEIGKTVCTTACPVRNDCGVAGRDEPESTWGGIDATERLALMLLATPEPAPVEHGKRGRYVAGCRCEPCTSANSRFIAEYRSREAVAVTGGRTVDFRQLAFVVEGVPNAC